MKKRRRIPREVQTLLDQARNLTESAPRKHHVVPASYLRRWTEAGRVRVTDVNEKRDFVAAHDKAARVTDFYRVASEDVDPEEVPPLLFEVLLSRIEPWGKAGIDTLLQAPTRIEPEVAALFSWFLAVQYTRGASFREMLASHDNLFFKLQYGSLTDAGIRRTLRERGSEVTDDAVRETRDFIDALNDGTMIVRSQDAELVTRAAQAAEHIGEHFLNRTWAVFRTARVMITCDEPVVYVAGPGSRRDERPGVLGAGAILFPLDPGHVLAMFDDRVAARLGPSVPAGVIAAGELDPSETIEVCREVAMNAHRWTFERPSKRLASRFQIPALPEHSTLESVAPIERDGKTGEVVRVFRKSRWASQPSSPWPVARWWQSASGPSV